MNNTNIVSQTVDIPLRVTMSATEGSGFEFKAFIDDGKILISPVNNEMQFDSVFTEDSFEFEVPIMEQPTEESTVDNLMIKSTSFCMTADMMTESENISVTASINDLGQIVLTPADLSNYFVSAVINDSLSLVTESLQKVEYFGYVLINAGDGWDVKDYSGNVIDEGVATLAEAKIVAITNELHILEGTLTENIDEPFKSTEEEDSSEVDSTNQDKTVDKDDIISRFLMGELALFTDDGTPNETLIELPELSHKGFKYYYDSDSGAVVSYHVGE